MNTAQTEQSEWLISERRAEIEFEQEQLGFYSCLRWRYSETNDIHRTAREICAMTRQNIMELNAELAGMLNKNRRGI